MKMQSTAAAIALIAAMGVSGQALAADPLATSPAPTTGSSALPDRTADALEAIGMDVKNQLGQDVGEVDDIVADKTTNEVYAVLAVGGFLGIGEKDVVVPLSSLNIGSENVILMSQSTADSLKASSPYDASRYRSLSLASPRPTPGMPDRGSDNHKNTPSNTGVTPDAASGGAAGAGSGPGSGTGGGANP